MCGLQCLLLLCVAHLLQLSVVVVEGRGVLHREEKHLLQVLLLKHLELLQGGRWGMKGCSFSLRRTFSEYGT